MRAVRLPAARPVDGTTRRVLERVPDDRLTWQPHAKSMTLGQLAQHVALIPGNISRMAAHDSIDMATRKMEYPAGESTAAILATLDASVTAARVFLSGLDEARASGTWRMTFGDREIFAIPRLGMLRTICFNHWYHHRGRLRQERRRDPVRGGRRLTVSPGRSLRAI